MVKVQNENLTQPLLHLMILGLSFMSLNAQSDDFDDGNDNGWTKANPLADLGVPATWTFPNGNSYNIAMEGHGIEPFGQPRSVAS